MIVINSFIWHLVLILIGIIVVLILLFIVAGPISATYELYMEHRKQRQLKPNSNGHIEVSYYMAKFIKGYDEWANDDPRSMLLSPKTKRDYQKISSIIGKLKLKDVREGRVFHGTKKD